MKRFIFVLITSFMFLSCATTSFVPLENYGLRSKDHDGRLIETNTDGLLFVGYELHYASKFAEENGYKYLVILNRDSEKIMTGVSGSTYGNNYFKSVSVSPDFLYFGELIAYVFNSEEEKEMFLDNGMGVRFVKDYSKDRKKYK